MASMIRLDRSGLKAPDFLEVRGRAELTGLEILARSGKLRSENFRSGIYSAPKLREEIWRAQFSKCCFCESPFESKNSTVEHFRPKASVRSMDGKAEIGYWWLAYELRNLMFCCRNCNGYKSDFFPVVEGTERLRWFDLPEKSKEQSLLVDPSCENPEEHLTFVRIPKSGRFRIAPKNGSERGWYTIRCIRLDREELDVLRDQYYDVHLGCVAEEFMKAKRRNDRTVISASLVTARRLVNSKAARFILLAKAVFKDCGMGDLGA